MSPKFLLTVNIFRKTYNWIASVGVTLAREFRIVFHDAGAMLFFFALPLLYPITYTLIYNPEIVEDLPVVIIDQCQNADSRELIRMIDATQSMKVYTQAVNLDEARNMMFDGKATAIFVIPADYSRSLGRMEPATIPVYCDMSLLLRYRAILSANTEIQLQLISDLTAERINTYGLDALVSTTLPVNSNSHMLGDPTQGFASFIMPGIVILILQQSMLLGICLIGGSRRERLQYGPYKIQYDYSPGVSATVIGRALCYVLLYIPMTIYVTHWIPEMFSLPHYGDIIDGLLFIFPMLLATAFLGQALVSLTRSREIPFLLIVFSSVIFLFLSGLTWPRYAMPDVWKWIGDMVPATWGVEGFIRINSNAATLAETSHPFYALWILTALYFVCALGVTALLRRRSARSLTKAATTD